MSKKFYAVNRKTGERWKRDKHSDNYQYLVMYDSGYLAIITQDFYASITPLDVNEWKVVTKENMKNV